MLSKVEIVRRHDGATVSHGGHSTAIDHVFHSGDRSGARRGEVGDEICYLARLGRTADWDTAKRVHQKFAGAIVISALVSCQLVDQAHGGFRLHPTGGNSYHANAPGTNL